MPMDLPEAYVAGWYIEKIDASDSVLVILSCLNRLIFISLSGCRYHRDRSIHIGEHALWGQ